MQLSQVIPRPDDHPNQDREGQVGQVGHLDVGGGLFRPSVEVTNYLEQEHDRANAVYCDGHKVWHIESNNILLLKLLVSLFQTDCEKGNTATLYLVTVFGHDFPMQVHPVSQYW
jgi:hypothetical protein